MANGYLSMDEFRALPSVTMTTSELAALPECITNGAAPPDEVGFQWKSRLSGRGFCVNVVLSCYHDDWSWYRATYQDGPDIEDLPVRWERIVVEQAEGEEAERG